MAFPKTYWYVKSGGWTAVSAWVAATSYNAGIWVRQAATPTVGNERCFICIVTGVSAGSEPTWAVTRGAKTVDNTATWMECTGVAGPCGDATDTLNWNSVKNTAVSLGAVIKDIAATTYFICVTSGNAGNGAEPTWSTATGTNTTDNTVTWMSMGSIASYATPFQYPFAREQSVVGTGFMLAGETAYFSNNHAETQAASMSITSCNGTSVSPIRLICVSDAAAPPTALATTATISTTGAFGINLGASATNGTSWYKYGLSYLAGSAANTASITLNYAQNTIYESCSFALNNTSASSIFAIAGNPLQNNWPYLKNCSFVFGATTQSFNNTNSSICFQMIGGSVAATGSVPATWLNAQSAHAANVTVRDVDLSALTGNIVNVGGGIDGYYLFQNCKLNAAATKVTGGISTWQQNVKFHNCSSSAINYAYYYQSYGGIIQQSTAIYNNAGATNGVTNLSWQFVTSANTTFVSPFESEPIAIWGDTTGSSKTATIELTCGTALTNQDMWIEIEELGSSAAPLGSNVSSRMAWFGSPAALTASGATWTGALANVYKIALAYTPQLKGPVKVRIFVAKPSLTVYVDPLITIS